MKRRPVQPDDGEPTDWPGSAQVSDFLTRQLAGRRLAARSCLTYGRSLKGFALWMKSNGGWDGDWSKLTARNLRDFVIERQGTHNRRSVHNQVSALRAFLADLRERGGITTTPAAGLVLPKLPKSLPKFLTEAQTDSLMDAAEGSEKDDPQENARDMAVLELLYGGGLRVSELCGIDGGDLDLGSGLVRLMGKGSKERVVPVGDAAITAVKAYLALRGAPARGEPLLLAAGGTADAEAQARDRRTARRPHPAQAPPRLRDASALQRRRSPPRAGAARPRLAFDHADLHAPQRRQAARGPS